MCYVFVEGCYVYKSSHTLCERLFVFMSKRIYNLNQHELHILFQSMYYLILKLWFFFNTRIYFHIFMRSFCYLSFLGFQNKNNLIYKTDVDDRCSRTGPPLFPLKACKPFPTNWLLISQQGWLSWTRGDQAMVYVVIILYHIKYFSSLFGIAESKQNTTKALSNVFLNGGRW